VARINKSIALQKGNNEQLDNLDVQSMVDEQPNVIQFAPLGKASNLKKSIDSQTKKSKKRTSGGGNLMGQGPQRSTNKTAEKGKKTTSLTDNRGDGKRSKSRGHLHENQKVASYGRRHGTEASGVVGSRTKSNKKRAPRKGSRDEPDSSDGSDDASQLRHKTQRHQTKGTGKSPKKGDQGGTTRAGKRSRDKQAVKHTGGQAAKDQGRKSKP
jgi:hypothetical protein